jgi:hypothetical protein
MHYSYDTVSDLYGCYNLGLEVCNELDGVTFQDIPFRMPTGVLVMVAGTLVSSIATTATLLTMCCLMCRRKSGLSSGDSIQLT